MLVLGRKEGESVRLGPDIVVTVAVIRTNYVRLCFEAPRDVPIIREELNRGIDETVRVSAGAGETGRAGVGGGGSD